jgi:DNA-binding transcriptional regulator PaaX
MAEGKQSVTIEVLKALIPYTEQNMKLAFKPNLFFNDLERITRSNRQTLANTLSRTKRQGLVKNRGGVPVLTKKGLAKLKELQSPDLLAGWLLVSFDIPETRRHDRYTLRSYLRLHGFRQLHKSLWANEYDYTQDLKGIIAELKLGQYVGIFVAASVYAPGLI